MTWHLVIENVGEGYCLPNMQSICVICFSKNVKYILLSLSLGETLGLGKHRVLNGKWRVEKL